MAAFPVALRFGEFTFDCRSHQLLRGRSLHPLSPKAKQLLQLLLEARPRAVSREELYDALWPSTFVCETNLATLVNELRRSLGDDARAARYIRTVHGFGYAFCGDAAPATLSAEPAASLVCEDRRYPLYDGENFVGRAEENRVLLGDPTISRHHAVIVIDAGGCTIRDLGSKNGTFIEGRRAGRSPVRLRGGETIQFGAVIASVRRSNLSSTATLRVNAAALLRDGIHRTGRL